MSEWPEQDNYVERVQEEKKHAPSPDAEYLNNLADAMAKGNQPGHEQRLRQIADKVQQADDEFNVALGQVITGIADKANID